MARNSAVTIRARHRDSLGPAAARSAFRNGIADDDAAQFDLQKLHIADRDRLEMEFVEMSKGATSPMSVLGPKPE
jgi:hypothetical protein